MMKKFRVNRSDAILAMVFGLVVLLWICFYTLTPKVASKKTTVVDIDNQQQVEETPIPTSDSGTTVWDANEQKFVVEGEETGETDSIQPFSNDYTEMGGN